MVRVGTILNGTTVYRCDIRQKYYILAGTYEVELNPLSTNPDFPPLKHSNAAVAMTRKKKS